MTTETSYSNTTYACCLRALATLSLVAVLTACAATQVEWIDVPLADNVFFDSSQEFRSDVVVIPVAANSSLEYMLTMHQGSSVAYQWKATDLSAPDLLLAEFHGHTIRTSDAPGEVMFYQQGRGESASGYLVAPFAGVHGWYLSNESDTDISVHLTLTGFYELP